MTPPCPGMSALESLTLNSLFSRDSNRSPACETIERISATIPRPKVTASPEAAVNPKPAAIAAIVPPMAPDQVLFGLIAGASFGPPIARPAK